MQKPCNQVIEARRKLFTRAANNHYQIGAPLATKARKTIFAVETRNFGILKVDNSTEARNNSPCGTN